MVDVPYVFSVTGSMEVVAVIDCEMVHIRHHFRREDCARVKACRSATE
jgi:hypothetical protein